LDLRLSILSAPRELPELTTQVVEMREKMRRHLATGDEHKVDLKQDQGGIADIEFLVQFMLLAHTKNHAQLANWTDNVRVLKELANLQIITNEEANGLIQAYLEYRNHSHRLALQNTKRAKASNELLAHKTYVIKIWNKYLLG
jgi:glutamate-ammonia-ligase adenylyltransferase